MTQPANVLATQVWVAKFNPQDSYKKPGVVALGSQRQVNSCSSFTVQPGWLIKTKVDVS